MAEPCLLVGDIGGTNARFAIADTKMPGFSGEKVVRCADYASAGEAISAYLRGLDVAQPTVICLAAAGPTVNRQIHVTNNHWLIDQDNLSNEFGTTSIRLLNDFEAIAYSIPLLDEGDLLSIGQIAKRDTDRSEYNIAVVGPGTGLGGVGLCRRQQALIPIVGELGHVGFSPQSEIQFSVTKKLAEQFGRVSNERLLSGPGIENIYWALVRTNRQDRSEPSAAEIFANAAQKNDPVAEQTLQIFFAALGQVAGDMALTLGAVDGVYIAGGIVQRYPEMLAASNFRQCFEDKGRQRTLMECIPTKLVMYPHPGLLGASFCAMEILHA